MVYDENMSKSRARKPGFLSQLRVPCELAGLAVKRLIRA